MHIRTLLLGVPTFVLGLAIGGPTLAATDASPLIGTPTSVTDGDTFRFGRTRVRLHGVDAPEMRRPHGGGRNPDGVAARAHLARLIEGQRVICDDTGERTYGRVVAVCRTDTVGDLSWAMAWDGWATDEPRFSGYRYALPNLAAFVAGRGMYRR